jgi:DsbE subfamily thiol:disulfide oxidoreductase
VQKAKSCGWLLLLLAAFSLVSGPLQAQGKRAPSVDYSAIPKLEEVKDHPVAPDFTLAGPDGRKISLKDFRGKLVILNFWASWCGPCRSEMPTMVKLHHEFRGKDFEIVAVNVKDKREDALAFMKSMKVTFPVMMDPEGEAGLLYGAFGMPITYLIDAKGVVLARLLGDADWYTPKTRELIRALLDKKKYSAASRIDSPPPAVAAMVATINAEARKFTLTNKPGSSAI